MTSHIHLIIGTDSTPLSDIVRDLKSYTSRRIRKEIESADYESRKKWLLYLFESQGNFNSNNKDYQFWIQNNHPITLDSNEMLDSRLDYIHNNPIKAGFVESPEHWIHSSAGKYYGIRKNKINLTLIE